MFSFTVDPAKIQPQQDGKNFKTYEGGELSATAQAQYDGEWRVWVEIHHLGLNLLDEEIQDCGALEGVTDVSVENVRRLAASALARHGFTQHGDDVIVDAFYERHAGQKPDWESADQIAPAVEIMWSASMQQRVAT